MQKFGVSIESSAGMKRLKGAMKNKAIEVRQDRLSEQLKLLWGKPVVLPQTEAENSMGDRDGVISSFRIPGYLVGGTLGGHIDIVDGKGYGKVPFFLFWERTIDVPSDCGSGCYWNAGEVWFWELRWHCLLFCRPVPAMRLVGPLDAGPRLDAKYRQP